MTNFICKSCPAINLRSDNEIKRINYRIDLKNKELSNISKLNLIILCESFPNGDYIYDIKMPANYGLRRNLKVELF